MVNMPMSASSSVTLVDCRNSLLFAMAVVDRRSECI